MLRVGTILRGIYRIDSYLSSGGFGNTYVATNIEFEETFAIKEFFMRGVTQRDDDQTTVSVSNSENTKCFLEQKEKFKKEARRLRKLNNEHIVKVHDLFEENGTAYYVMDYVDGENLAERLERTGKPLTEQEVRQLLPQILDALSAVHKAGIWHLDIKPSNIMVDKSGSVKLIDFGASKQMSASGGPTTNAPTVMPYTPGYAPGEQMEQNIGKIGPWTDIYALGATLYALLTNRKPPLPSDINDDMSVDKHLALPFPNGIGNDLRFYILRMMLTNWKLRPQSIEELLSEWEYKFSPKVASTKSTTRTYAKNSPKKNIDEETLIDRPASNKHSSNTKRASSELNSSSNPVQEKKSQKRKKLLNHLIWILPILVLIVAGFKIAIKAQNRFGSFLAIGISSIFAIQVVFSFFFGY